MPKRKQKPAQEPSDEAQPEKEAAEPEALPEVLKERKKERPAMPIGTVTPRNVTDEMQESYLTYAMSVIVARALPDVRDGLKPVHRRILYAMHGLGLKHSAKFLKSARIVGDVLGKYHPHGDSSVYDAMVRMAQEFSLRYTLVDGQGNFGSVDGDNAAAYRYTEARMDSIAEEMLIDIDKETVEFRDNYDGKEQEPMVLPAKLPNFIINGTEGIAVGMATKVPPHNLSEVIDAVVHLIEHPDCSVDDLMKFVKGPDFPTGGYIYDGNSLRDAYMTGRGKVTVRAKAEIVERKGKKFDIIITEIPYQVNKSTLIESIAKLVQEKKIVGVADLRDESDKGGLRVVIELKGTAYPKKVLNQLFKYTQLQSTFHLNMIALVDGVQPKLLNLKAILEAYVGHRREVITRRTKYELAVAEARKHILEGLKLALDHIDAVITTIRKSKTRDEAHQNLSKKFKLSDLQATAILEMRLQALAGLERKRIDDELKEKIGLIGELKEILSSEKKILSMIKKEIAELKAKYGDERRTQIYSRSLEQFSDEDLIANEPMIVTLTDSGYIKRLAPSTYRAQQRGGKGVVGSTTKDEDSVDHILVTNTHDDIMFFTNKGRAFRLKVHEVPQATRQAKGQAIANLIQIKQDEYVTTLTCSNNRNKTDQYYFMATTTGVVKKTKIEEFDNVRASGIIALKLRPGDSLKWVRHTTGSEEIMLVTKMGQSIRFHEKDVRPMGRSSTGVGGIKLHKDDLVVNMLKVKRSSRYIFTLSEHGYGKRTLLDEYKVQSRAGSGIRVATVTEKTGFLIGADELSDDTAKTHDLIVASRKGQVMRTGAKSIPVLGRSTQGVIIMRVPAEDGVSSFTIYGESTDKTIAAEAEQQKISQEDRLAEGGTVSGVAVNVKSEELKEAVAAAPQKNLTKQEVGAVKTLRKLNSPPAKPAAKPTPKKAGKKKK